MGNVLLNSRWRTLPLAADMVLKPANLHVPCPRSERGAPIAAMATVHGVVIVTGKITDFGTTGIVLMDPWACRNGLPSGLHRLLKVQFGLGCTERRQLKRDVPVAVEAGFRSPEQSKFLRGEHGPSGGTRDGPRICGAFPAEPLSRSSNPQNCAEPLARL